MGYTARSGTKIKGVRTFGPQGSLLHTTEKMAVHYGQTRFQRIGTPILEAVSFTVAGQLKGPNKFIRRNLSPYVLGILIGDGSLTVRGSATFTSADPAISARVEAELGCKLKVTRTKSRAKQYRIPASSACPLEDLGLWGKKSEEKFIPRIYMLGNIAERLALFQGLMDSDGYADTDGDAFYCSTSERLADDVRDLARSLGCLVYKVLKPQRRYTHNGEMRIGQDAFDLRIKSFCPDKLFHLPRKKRRVTGKQYQSLTNWITTIEPAGSGRGFSIVVDHPSQLYITDHYIMSHS